MKLITRPGTAADLRQAAEILNEIIEIGGTTARTEQTNAESLGKSLLSEDGYSAWHVIEDASGTILGFQWIGPHSGLPPEACDISTFVKPGQTGLGIGSQLFEATKQAANELGYDWINANIRADNNGGLAYYQSQGFRDWNRVEDVSLDNGMIVDKILKRYDLKD